MIDKAQNFQVQSLYKLCYWKNFIKKMKKNKIIKMTDEHTVLRKQHVIFALTVVKG